MGGQLVPFTLATQILSLLDCKIRFKEEALLQIVRRRTNDWRWVVANTAYIQEENLSHFKELNKEIIFMFCPGGKRDARHDELFQDIDLLFQDIDQYKGQGGNGFILQFWR